MVCPNHITIAEDHGVLSASPHHTFVLAEYEIVFLLP
jgi:hypothetical protein